MKGEEQKMVSVIVPVYNEEGSVALLHGEIVSVMRSLSVPFEVIFVDDGSKDRTFEILQSLSPIKVTASGEILGKPPGLTRANAGKFKKKIREFNWY